MFLEMFVTVMLVSAGTPGSDNMAIHCSHLEHGPTLLSWCPRLFLSETHTLRSGCETTAKAWRYYCGR